MKALRIQNIYFTAPDIGKVKTFYQEFFALELKFQDQDKWIQYDLNGHNLALASHDEGGNHKNGIVVFEIDGADHLQERLEELGGTLIATRNMGEHGTTYTASDPEGNTFQLFTRAKSESR